MAYKYETLDDVIEATNDERCIGRDDVKPALLDAKVWHMIASFPGCLGDNHDIARNREHVLAGVERLLDEGREYSARYVRGQLRRFGICYLRDGRVITLERHTVGRLF